MRVDGKDTRTIWLHPEQPEVVQIIDQRALPHRFVTGLITERGVCPAIEEGILSLFPDRISQ